MTDNRHEHIEVFSRYKEGIRKLEGLVGERPERRAPMLAHLSEDARVEAEAIIADLCALVRHPCRYEVYLASFPCCKTHLCDVLDVRFNEEAETISTAFRVLYRLVDDISIKGTRKDGNGLEWQRSKVLGEFLRPRAGMANYWMHNPIASYLVVHPDPESELTQRVLRYG